MTSHKGDPQPQHDQGPTHTHPQDTSPNVKAEALRCAQRGWHVFPVHSIKNGVCTCSKGVACSRSGKHPRTSNGVKDATTDKRTILDWWTKWPNANIGVATGAVSGLLVLDVDPRHSGDGSLEALINQHGHLPDTVQVMTGRGGIHVYFEYDATASTGNSVSKLGPGLDVRSDGGYVVAPPSLHQSGQRYEWEASAHPHDQALLPPPPWLTTYLLGAAGRATRSDGEADESNRVDPTAVLTGVREGERNDTLFRFVARLRRLGLVAEEASVLALAAAAACDPPLHAAEASRIVTNVYSNYPSGLAAAGYLPMDLSAESRTERFLVHWGSEVENLPTPDWLVDGIMTKESFVVLYGAAGIGKTFIVLDLAGAIASGQLWQGHDTLPAPVVYVAAEGVGDLGLRHEALRIGRGLDDLPDLGYITEPVNLYSDHDVESLIELLGDRAPALIVFDTLARSMDGADENFAKDMNTVIKNVDRLRHKTGATVMLIHHTGQDKSRERGSTALKGAADVVIKLTGKVTDTAKLHCDKMKMATAFEDISVRFEMAGPSLTVVSRGLAPTLADNQRNSLTLVSEESLTHTQWLEAFKKAGHGSKSTFGRAVTALKVKGFVENGDGGRGNPYGITILGREALGVIAPTKVSEGK